MAGAGAKLALYWLNSLIDVPSALLVNRLEDLHDGVVLCDVARELQSRYSAVHSAGPQSYICDVATGIWWLAETFGYLSLPTEISSAGAATRIERQHVLTIAALVNFMKSRMNELEMLNLQSSPAPFGTTDSATHGGRATGRAPSPRDSRLSDFTTRSTIGMTRWRPGYDRSDRVETSNAIKKARTESPIIEPVPGDATSIRVPLFQSPDLLDRSNSDMNVTSFGWHIGGGLNSGKMPAQLRSFAPASASVEEAVVNSKVGTAPPEPASVTRAAKITAGLRNSTSNGAPTTASVRQPLRSSIASSATERTQQSTRRLANRTSARQQTDRPSWNGSTISAEQEHTATSTAKASVSHHRPNAPEAPKRPMGLRVGGLYDPSYQPKTFEPQAVKTTLTPAGPTPASFQAHSEKSAPAVRVLPPPTPTAAGNSQPISHSVSPMRSSAEGSTALPIIADGASSSKQQGYVDWVKGLGLPFDGQVNLACNLKDGVLLSALAVALEHRSGNRIPSMQLMLHGRHLAVLPGTVAPKHDRINAAAASKNLELALDVFRKNPKVAARFLWSGDDLRGGTIDHIALGLIEDLYKAYSQAPARTRKALTTSAAAAPLQDDLSVQPLPENPGAIMDYTVQPQLAVAQRLHVVAHDISSTQCCGVDYELAGTVSTTAADGGTGATAVRNPIPRSGAHTARHLSLMPEPSAVPSEALHMLPSTIKALQARGIVSKALKPVRSSDKPTFDEVRVRSWLQDLGLSTLAPANSAIHKHVLDDPILNGVLLVEVVKLLEPDAPPLSGSSPFRHFAKPKSLAEARANIEAALSTLRTSVIACGASSLEMGDAYAITIAGGARRIPQHLLWCCEELLIGNKDMAWCLFDAIRETYAWNEELRTYTSKGYPLSTAAKLHRTQPSADVFPDTAALVSMPTTVVSPPGQHTSRTRSRRSSAPTSLPPMDVQCAEIVTWLRNEGILNPAVKDSAVWTSEGLIPQLTSGALLAQLVHMLTGQVVRGFIWPAATANLARQNLSKCLETLGGLKSIGKAILSRPHIVGEIFEGNVPICVNLLYDCLRFFRGEPPLAVIMSGKQSVEHATAGPPNPTQVFHPDDVFTLGPFNIKRKERTLLPPSPTGASTPAYIVRDPKELLQMPPPVISAMLENAAPQTERCDGNAEVLETTGKEAQELAAIASWLASLGIAMQRPELLLSNAPRPECAEFQDGTLLVRIVEACENLRGLRRGGIVGVDKHPRTAAAKLGNIRRALEVLRENRSMMLDFLWSELAIREGSPSVIRGILMHIRKAYGFHAE